MSTGLIGSALVDLETLRTYLRKHDTEDDNLLVMLINAITVDFEAYCNRTFRFPMLTGTGLAFVDSNPDTITDSGGGFVKAGFESGMAIGVEGSTSNDTEAEEYLTISSLVAGTLTLLSTDAVTVETAGQEITLVGLFTEHHDGKGRDWLRIDNPPVREIKAIWDDSDREYGADSLVDSDDYLIDDSGMFVRLDGSTFGNGLRNVRIVYEGGYRTTPDSLALAACEQVSIRYRQAENLDLGVRSRSLPDGSTTTIMVDPILPQIRRVLDSFWIPSEG